METIEEAYRLAKQVGDVTVLLRVYNNYPSIVSGFGSDHRRAIEVLREGIELAERAGAVGNLAWLMGTLSDSTVELGDLEETERTERRALALAEESGDEPLRGIRMRRARLVPLPAGEGRRGRGASASGRRGPGQEPRAAGRRVRLRDRGIDRARARSRGGSARAPQGRGRAVAWLHGGPSAAALLRVGSAAPSDGRSTPKPRDTAISPGAAGPPRRRRTPTRSKGSWRLTRSSRSIACGLRRTSSSGWGSASCKRACSPIWARRSRGPGRIRRPALEQARDLLVACDAVIYLPEVEALLASTAAGR